MATSRDAAAQTADMLLEEDEVDALKINTFFVLSTSKLIFM